MGAYLSQPNTTKNSSDEDKLFLACGSSSMQGWRISQEDAHNCILEFDTNTSFFAVYDGHGGSEVAAYCSKFLPDFLKKLQSYTDKDFEKALKDAFIGFDATLLEKNVIDELKKLATKNSYEDEAVEEEEYDNEDENVADLYKEATMPLNELLKQYKDKKNPALQKLKDKDDKTPISPFLKGKRRSPNEAGASSSSGCNSGASSSKACSSSSSSSSNHAGSSSSMVPERLATKDDNETVDSTVSSSNQSESCKDDAKLKAEPSSSDEKHAEQSNEISDTSSSSKNGTTAKPTEMPDISSSTSDEAKKDKSKTTEGSSVKVINGDITSSTSEMSSEKGKIPHENGEVTSNSSPEAIAKKSSAAAMKATNNLDDDSSDEDTDDEEFPAADDTSSTEEGEECDEEMEDAEEEEIEEEDEDEEDYLAEEDEAFINSIVNEPGKDSGCTAVVALLHGKDLYVANAGDSRCVVCRKGQAVEMSLDHKPEDQIEFERIKKAGGRVTLDGRVNGGLNLSRAIGDHGYKMNKELSAEEQMISALPDVKKLELTDDDEFMVLACDGIWNYMTSEDVVEFIQKRIQSGITKMSLICEEMFDHCLAPHTMGDGTGCDNMTAIIVQFKSNSANKPEATVSRKRAASPDTKSTTAETTNENEQEQKRQKTVDVEAEVKSDEKSTTAAVAETSEST
uniref:protein-serine/threonine phosphatase n=1 Tax=Corethrella appendiculata TaxID=1370023 RepID=U5EYB3_9DIPT